MLTILARLILWLEVLYHSFRCKHGWHDWQTFRIDYSRAIKVEKRFTRYAVQNRHQRCMFCPATRIQSTAKRIARDWQHPERRFEPERHPFFSIGE